ncbi:MAG: site-2 protease family protein [Candidatus Paceibacterota bacterium]|jgi:Zn-dependent protease
MQEIGFIFQIAIIIVSIVFHELSHGYAAYFLGDPTAKYAGRLTLNPIKHLEVFGSVIVPLLTFALGGIVFGWAKPVPYNPYNLRAKKYGEVIVALAGPVSNLLIATVFALYIRTLGGDIGSSPTGQLAVLIVLVNLTLAVFNLIPVPPLDGSKILWGLLPYRWHPVKAFIERNMIAFIIVVILTISFILDPIVSALFSLLTGISFI